MLQFIKFQPEHVALIVPQAGLEYELEVAAANADKLALGPAFTGVVHGKVIGAAGFVEVWPGRAACWALLSPQTGRYMRDITRFVRKVMDDYATAGVRRYETTVNWDYLNGWRWAKLIGMKLETPNGMDAYGPQGQRMALFAKVYDERS